MQSFEAEIAVALIFPTYCESEDDFAIARKCYEETKAKSGQTEIVVTDDASPHEETRAFFAAEAEAGHCSMVQFDENAGLTRSWNGGALFAMQMGADVIVFGNQDAYPSSRKDLEALALTAWKSHKTIFAVGPLSNNPGHMPRQRGTGRGEGVEPAPYLNGFTWAVAVPNILEVYGRRKRFLIDDTDKRFDFSKQEAVEWEGPERMSLAHVGQEDELFAWAKKELEKGCLIVRGSFFYHDKLSIHRRVTA